MSEFKDHFSGHASAYSNYRPRYPAELFAAIRAASNLEGHAPPVTVWDVGCGNGQASVALADQFDRVEATDASAAQIATAERHPRVRYTVSRAEASGLESHSVDAILVAQALHWFDFDRFYAEARRVCRPGGLIVAVAYELASITPEIDRTVQRFYQGDIGPYWPPDRGHIETGYRDIPWPFPPVELGKFSMSAEWPLNRVVGYIGTWSAVARYRQATGIDPLPAFAAELAAAWGDPEQIRKIEWPLIMRAGRIQPAAGE